MPALPPYLIEPIWQQFSALLPQRRTSHPLGCHRPRIPDRVVFEKLVGVLVLGCSYGRIADEACSATTLRDRRDEWIEMGAMAALREMALEAYDRLLAQRPQEAGVVHGEARKGGGLLGGLLGRGHHRQAARPGGLDPLPLGRSSFPQAMTYPRSL